MSIDQIRSLPPEFREQRLEKVVTVAKQRIGSRPAPSSIWRWVRRGLRGGQIKLRAVLHGGQWYTTTAAFDEFIVNQTNAALKGSPREDDKTLREAGLL